MPPGERHVLLGLAQACSGWFGEVSRWHNTGALSAEFVRALAVEEVRALLRSSRRFSALIVDASVPECDRDLIELAASRACAVVVVDGDPPRRAWQELGADAVVPAELDLARLLEVLEAVARPVLRADQPPAGLPVAAPSAALTPLGWRGRLVAVTGAGGTGRSTLAMALATALARDPRDRGLVLVADLALHAQQGLLHDAGDVLPGLPELVEGHRRGGLDPLEVRRLCFQVSDRGYDLLLGLRRHRDWTALRPHAVEASLHSLRTAYRYVVADVDADVEGEAESGAIEVEERNQLARTALREADLVLVVGRAGLGGVHTLLRVLAELAAFGVPGDRLLPVVNRAPRSPRRRAEVGQAMRTLLAEVAPGVVPAANPVFVTERRWVDDIVADGGQLPPAIGGALAGAVRALVNRGPAGPEGGHDGGTAGSRERALPVLGVAVAPGSLGSWTTYH